jgi:hypothetical protein
MSSLFSPTGETVGITVSSASSNRQEMTGLDPLCGAVRLRHTNTGNVYIKFGDSTVSATTESMQMGPGTELIKPPPGSTHIAVRGDSSGSISMTIGQI